MINENRNGLTLQPWPVLLPVIAIALLTIGTSLIGDGINRVADLLGLGVLRPYDVVRRIPFAKGSQLIDVSQHDQKCGECLVRVGLKDLPYFT